LERKVIKTICLGLYMRDASEKSILFFICHSNKGL
jgi:hypothetical protein